MLPKLWATLEKKNHIYYEQAPEKVALFLLPPYSPEYNPIEKTWAHIKKHLKKVLPSCNTFFRGSFVLFLFQLTIESKAYKLP